MTTTDRLDDERSVLAALFTGNAHHVAIVAEERLDARMFSTVAHRSIAEVLDACAAIGRAPTPRLVCRGLEHLGALRAAGGARYVRRIHDEQPLTGTRACARRIREAHVAEHGEPRPPVMSASPPPRVDLNAEEPWPEDDDAGTLPLFPGVERCP